MLRRVLPPRVLDALDLDTLELLSSATTRPSLGERDGDLLFSVRLRGYDDSRSIRIAFEHYSNAEPLQTFRALVYAGEQWGRIVAAQAKRPQTLPFILPIVFVQPPACHAPTRLSDIIDLPADLREAFGIPFEVKLHVDDLSGTVLDDPYADAGHLALVEITRTLLYSYKNHEFLDEPRIASLAPLFDAVLVHFGSAQLTELLTYVVEVFGPESPLCAIIHRTFGKAAREMYVTIAEDMRAKGIAEGRAKGIAEGLAKGRATGLAEGRALAKAEALLRILEHRTLPLSRAIRERVVATPDETLLQHWFERALCAATIEAVFDG